MSSFTYSKLWMCIFVLIYVMSKHVILYVNIVLKYNQNIDSPQNPTLPPPPPPPKVVDRGIPVKDEIISG